MPTLYRTKPRAAGNAAKNRGKMRRIQQHVAEGIMQLLKLIPGHVRQRKTVGEEHRSRSCNEVIRPRWPARVFVIPSEVAAGCARERNGLPGDNRLEIPDR